MCGRFAMTGDLDFYARYYGVDDVDANPAPQSWNVAPTDETYVVAEREGERQLQRMRWGLIPHWAEDTKTIHINARAESIATKPAFKRAFSRHRCLVPADGFYEWEPKEQGRTPHWIYRADGFPMSFAAIWSGWKDPASDTWIRRYAIVTTEARGVIASVHHRMPVILSEAVWDGWLDGEIRDSEAALSLIQGIDPDLIMEHPVTSMVNSVRNNGPELIEEGRDSLF